METQHEANLISSGPVCIGATAPDQQHRTDQSESSASGVAGESKESVTKKDIHQNMTNSAGTQVKYS